MIPFFHVLIWFKIIIVYGKWHKVRLNLNWLTWFWWRAWFHILSVHSHAIDLTPSMALYQRESTQDLTWRKYISPLYSKQNPKWPFFKLAAQICVSVDYITTRTSQTEIELYPISHMFWFVSFVFVFVFFLFSVSLYINIKCLP
jgi:hypothetical protein